MNELSVSKVMAKVTRVPAAIFLWEDLIHFSAIPSLYGCSILRVVDATSRSPARRCRLVASESLMGRSLSRLVWIIKSEPC